MKSSAILMMLGVLLLAGCAAPIKPAEPSAMVPKMLKTVMPTNASIYVAKTTLASAAAEGKAPFDELTGQFPLVQPQGLENYQESIRLALIAAGTQTAANSETASYVLRPVILGGMAIPFPESYSILFVHYQLEDAHTGKIVWSKNVYSQAKLENPRAAMGKGDVPDSGYALLAAANLRQMVTALSDWLATTQQNQQ
jgi:hypothetical protein